MTANKYKTPVSRLWRGRRRGGLGAATTARSAPSGRRTRSRTRSRTTSRPTSGGARRRAATTSSEHQPGSRQEGSYGRVNRERNDKRHSTLAWGACGGIVFPRLNTPSQVVNRVDDVLKLLGANLGYAASLSDAIIYLSLTAFWGAETFIQRPPNPDRGLRATNYSSPRSYGSNRSPSATTNGLRA